MGGKGSGRKKKEPGYIVATKAIQLNMKRPGSLTALERIDMVRDQLYDISASPLVTSMKERWEQEKSGIGADVDSYLQSSDEAVSIIYSTPDILDHYQINLSTGWDPSDKKVFTPVEQIIYFWANPWLVAERVFGMENLNKATALSAKFKGFIPFQKQFLRDALDPRRSNMLFTACRAGSKTWLTALAVLIMSYLAPKMRIMITSGSQEQSDNLYRYFTDLAEGTPYQRLVLEGKMLKTKTRTVAGGWVISFPASHKKVHGPRPDVVVCDEACKAESDIIMAAFSAAMSAQKPKFIVTSTPDNLVHIFTTWLWEAKRQSEMQPVDLAKVSSIERWYYYHLTAYDCPWITEETIESLTHKYGGKQTHEFKIFIMGIPAAAEGLIFNEEWIDAAIVDSLPETIKIDVEENGETKSVEVELVLSNHITGLDVGGKHPTAVGTNGEDQNGHLWFIDDVEVNARSGDEPIELEVYRQSSEYWSKVIADAAPVQYFTNRKIKKKLQEDGLPGLQAVSFKKEKLNMISAARGLFEAGMIHILRRKCEKLINQLYTYAYDEDRDDDMPEKRNDDHVDMFLCSVWPHRKTFIRHKYKRALAKTYNLEDHMEPINPSPYQGREVDPYEH